MMKEFTVQTPQDFVSVIDYIFSTMTESSVVIALEGDLGAGKTTFTQVLAKQLGVSEAVTSPTFTIMKQYQLTSNRFERLVHIDAYRFEDISEARPLQLAEIFTEPRTIVCVEWPERISSIVPTAAVRVKISAQSDEARTVQVELPPRK